MKHHKLLTSLLVMLLVAAMSFSPVMAAATDTSEETPAAEDTGTPDAPEDETTELAVPADDAADVTDGSDENATDNFETADAEEGPAADDDTADDDELPPEEDTEETLPADDAGDETAPAEEDKDGDIIIEVEEDTEATELTDVVEEEKGYVPPPEKMDIANFVIRCYNVILWRGPDDEGLEKWVDDLYYGRKNAAQILAGFFFSKEFTDKNYSDNDYVYFLYQAAFDREPDTTGKTNRLKELEYGFTRRYSLYYIVKSPEFKKLCAKYGIEPGSIALKDTLDLNPNETKYVYNVYQNVLGRKPERSGHINNVKYLKNNGARPLIAKFFNTSEYKNKNKPDSDYITDVFVTALNRTPEASAVTNRLNMLDVGLTRNYVLKGVLSSSEFTNKATKAGVTPGVFPDSRLAIRDNYPKVTEYVYKVFSQALNRKPTASYLDSYSEKLAQGDMLVRTFLKKVLLSSECTNKNPANEDFVKTVYKAVMFRPADTAGLNSRTIELNNGASREAVLNYLALSSECRNKVQKYGLQIYYDGLVEIPAGIKYYDEDTVFKGGWKWIDKDRYYFDTSTGLAKTGWHTLQGPGCSGSYKYYFKPDGINLQDLEAFMGDFGPFRVEVCTSKCVTTIYCRDENGNYTIPYKSFVCSPGENDCTVKGTYTLRRLGEWGTLMGPVYGQYLVQIWQDYLFHSTWYYNNRDRSSLSVYEHNFLGKQRSHGCVRMAVKDVKWIYDNCNGATCYIATYLDTPFDKPEPVLAVPISGDYGKDPTDPWWGE